MNFFDTSNLSIPIAEARLNFKWNFFCSFFVTHNSKWTKAINCFVNFFFFLSLLLFRTQSWRSWTCTENVGMECVTRGFKTDTRALVELWGTRSIFTLFARPPVYRIYFLLTYWQWSRHLGLFSVSIKKYLSKYIID